MSLVTMRPTFRLRLQGSFAEVQAKLETALRSPTWREGSQCFGDYCEFHVPEDQQRYWSPHMAVHLEPLDEQDQIVYRGVLPTPGPEWQDGESPAADTRAAFAASVAGGATTLLVGRFAPRQEVWMLVWIVYLALAFTAFFSAVYLVVQLWLGDPPLAATGIVLSLVGIGALHWVSRTGQNWSSDQMVDLRQRLDQVLESAELQVVTSDAKTRG